MKKSILLTSLIVVLCLSVLFTAPAAASVGGGEDVESNPEKTVDYLIYLPLVTRNFGAPKLVSPANGSTLNTLIPDFVWEEMEIPMRFMMVAEISENNDFSTIVDFASQKSNTSAQLYFNLKPATKYYWRAFVINWSDLTRYPHSETWSFTTPSHGVLPDAPTLKSPAHESVIESGPVVLEVNEVP